MLIPEEWGQPIARYEDFKDISTSLDKLQSALTFFKFLVSTDYVVSLMDTRWGIGKGDAVQRARRVASHANAAVGFIEQALNGPEPLSFLPAYYAILDFLKIAILFSPLHSQLNANRTHGVSYLGHEKNSQSLLTEEISIKK